MRTYYLALVDKTDTTFNATFARHDEIVRSFSISQQEGDFCGLTVTIERPGQTLLDPARPQWVWLSMEEGSALTPLFFGRVVGVPADIQGDFYTIEFLAKPADFEAQKLAVAAGLRVAPYFDYAFVDPQMWEDADTVLEARTDVWHIDRVTNDVSVSSIIAGEDGTVSITSDQIPVEGFSLSYSDAPLRKVNLELRAMWTQRKTGSIDITRDLLSAFQAAGSPAGYVTSYTGSGLYDDWPMEGDQIGDVYSFGPQTIEVADGLSIKRKFKKVSVKYERAPTSNNDTGSSGSSKVAFRRWAFTISSSVNYDVGIDRTEDISFGVYADVQSVVNDADDAQSETITLSSGSIGTTVGTGSAAEVPIGDVSRDAYFPTSRGRASIEFGLSHARALLLRRARAVEIRVSVPIATAIAATCRKSATVYHPGLPGGVATGKIVSYQFGVDGDSGAESGEITLACFAGKASSFPAVTGSPTYAEATYVGSDYQEYSGALVVAGVTDMRYELPTAINVSPAVVGLSSVTVNNGETAQKAVMKKTYIDISAAADAVNNVHTEVDLRMVPVDTSPRDVRYSDTAVDLPVPKGVDLGEAA